MELSHIDTEDVDKELEPLASRTLRGNQFHQSRYPGAVRQRAYIFDGDGNYYNKDWDLVDGRGKEFCWYHVELPKGNQKLSQSAQYLIDALCPPLKLQDILSLVSNGPFCGHVDGALVFRVNSPGPASSKFTFRIAARVTENSVITVSLGRVPRLGFSPANESLLSEIPVVESPSCSGNELKDRGGTVIAEHVLDFLLTMNHSEEADNPVPRSVSNLLVHIIDTHVDHLQDVVTRLEIELDSVEIELDKGTFFFDATSLLEPWLIEVSGGLRFLILFSHSLALNYLDLHSCGMTLDKDCHIVVFAYIFSFTCSINHLKDFLFLFYRNAELRFYTLR